MFHSVTPEKAIAFTQLCVALTCCWPPPLEATRSQTMFFKFLRIMAILNGVVVLFPLLYALHVYKNDAEILSKAAVETVAVTQLISQTILCATQYDRYQLLIDGMKVCCLKANPLEKRVLQRYVDKYSTFYGISAGWFYMAAIMVVIGAFFVSDPFPISAEYPFPVNSEPLRSIIFAHQGLYCIQCASHLSMNIFCALVLLFTAARFEILIAEVRDVKDTESLIRCVQKYRAVKRYATEASKGMRIIAMLTIIFTSLASVFSAISIIGKTSLTVKVQSLFLLGAGLLEAFMCALPADHLMEMVQNHFVDLEIAMQEVYKSEWYTKPVSLQKSVLFTMIPQPSVVLSVKCIMPVLSLNYFCSFLSSVFSMFTAFRMVLTRDEDD